LDDIKQKINKQTMKKTKKSANIQRGCKGSLLMVEKIIGTNKF